MLSLAIEGEVLNSLLDSTVHGIADKDCFFDQLHYVNRHFVKQHGPYLKSLVANKLQTLHQGITTEDLTYVNDFIAPINLNNAQIHTSQKGNRYGWHSDLIDRHISPCYNLWIPLFTDEAISNYDGLSLFNVIEKDKCPAVYKNFEQDAPVNAMEMSHLGLEFQNVTCEFLQKDLADIENSLIILGKSGAYRSVDLDQINVSSVKNPTPGGAYLFGSDQLHSTGDSSLKRIGIVFKFLINNPKFGFKKSECISRDSPDPISNWGSLFLSSYYQFNDFISYEKFLPVAIQYQRKLLEDNIEKLHDIKSYLNMVRRCEE